jgi:hypothetical protein
METINTNLLDLEKELCRSYDKNVDWLAEELVLQPNSKHFEIHKAFDRLSLT